jgi:hypothetical protein
LQEAFSSKIFCNILRYIETKKEGGQEGDRNSASVWHCGDQGLFEI